PMPLHPPPQHQQHHPAPAPASYHYDSLAASAQPQQQHYDSLAGSAQAPQPQYHTQPPLPPPQLQDTSQQHLAGYAQSAAAQVSAAPGIGTVPARFLSAATTSTQQQQQQQLPALGSHQLGLVGHSAPLPAPAPAPAVSAPTAATAPTPSAQLPQPFVSPHGIPTSLLGHGAAVANAEYGVWFYPHQPLPQTDRSMGMAGMAGSASASPLSQHTIASTDQSYPLQGQFDSQMRYMAVPGQPSGASKPMVSAALPIDRSLRPISIASHQQQQQQQQQQHGLAAMHYSQSPAYPSHAQYHPSYYHPQHQMPQQALHPSILPSQPQHPQHHPPFPAQPSALAATAPMSECSSTHTSVGTAANGGVMHPGAYSAMHPASIDSVPSDQVSAAQVAAAVAAAAVSAHSIPVSNSAVGVGSGASGSASGSAIGLGGSRLAVGTNDPEHSAIPAFKFSMSMPTNSESSIPEYFEVSARTSACAVSQCSMSKALNG
ncbi:hypothetical protein H4R20_006154, partial [Coemansia guatemalensis]